jgi:hypothetical protein
MRRRVIALALLLVFVGGMIGLRAADAPEDAALARTRKTVRMLDDIYKSAVVLITEHYVNESSDLPAGTAAKALFAAVEQKGWHQVRLVDATGQPIETVNSPADDFERQAIQALLDGQGYIDQVVELDGQRYLRAATPIPVVLEKCVMCHAHYGDAKEGQPIGALIYKLPVE